MFRKLLVNLALTDLSNVFLLRFCGQKSTWLKTLHTFLLYLLFTYDIGSNDEKRLLKVGKRRFLVRKSETKYNGEIK